MGFFHATLPQTLSLEEFVDSIDKAPLPNIRVECYNDKHNAHFTMGALSTTLKCNGTLNQEALEEYFGDSIHSYRIAQGIQVNNHAPPKKDAITLNNSIKKIQYKKPEAWFQKCLDHLGFKKKRWSSTYKVSPASVESLLNAAQEYYAHHQSVCVDLRGEQGDLQYCSTRDPSITFEWQRVYHDGTKDYDNFGISKKNLSAMLQAVNSLTQGVFSKLKWEAIIRYNSNTYVPPGKNIDTVTRKINNQLSSAIKQMK